MKSTLSFYYEKFPVSFIVKSTQSLSRVTCTWRVGMFNLERLKPEPSM